MSIPKSGIAAAITAALVALLVMISGPLAAGEVKSSVVAVDPDGEVELRLQPGNPVSIGDEVRIEAEIPGLGMLPIKTRWQIVTLDQARSIAIAVPQGEVTGTPQVGYDAIILTTQTAGTDPAPAAILAPKDQITFNAQPCDHVGGSPDDPDLAGIAQGVSFADMDADAVIRECLAAIDIWPSTPRFYTQLMRGYFKAGQMENAFNTAMTGAEMDSGHATAFLAIFYMTGKHVQKDEAEALRLFEIAAGLGNPGGMVYAAGMYYNGNGTMADAFAAAHYYQMAADIGVPEAYANLGILYDTGQGVPWNPVEAAENLLVALALDADLARSTLLEGFADLSFETRIEIQKILSDAGNYSGMVDGADDPATHRALLAHIMQ